MWFVEGGAGRHRKSTQTQGRFGARGRLLDDGFGHAGRRLGGRAALDQRYIHAHAAPFAMAPLSGTAQQ
jgi:hypothetical protein